MIELNTTRNTNIKFLLSPRDYQGLYNKLEQHLPQELLRFFAKPIKVGNNVKWYLDNDENIGNNKIKSYTELSEEEKDIVSDYIGDIKPRITKILRGADFFRNTYDKYFQYPHDRDLKVIMTDFEPIVILTQWACQDQIVGNSIDKLTAIINRPQPDKQKVQVFIKYKDGSIAEKRQFYYEYSHKAQETKVEKKERTNIEGLCNLRKLKIGATISIYDIVDDKKCYIHSYTIEEGTEIYEAVFPLFADVKVKVINQKNDPVSNIDIVIDYEGDKITRNTLEYGHFTVENLEVTKTITISEKEKSENSIDYTIKSDKNEVVLNIVQPFYSDAQITVINQEDEVVPDVQLLLDLETKKENYTEKEYKSDKDGLIKLTDVLIGSTIKAVQKSNSTNTFEYLLSETENEFIFKIRQQFFADAKIKVIDQENNELSDEVLLIEYTTKDGTEQKELTTNAAGIILLKSLLVGTEIRVSLPDKPDKSETYTVERTDNDFIFKIEKIRRKVLVVQHDETPIIETKIEFKNNRKKIVRYTDKEGYCLFDEDELATGRLKAKVYITKVKKNGKKKTQIRRRTIKIKY